MKKMILFLIRKHLGVKKFEPFTFVGQKSHTFYYFNDEEIVKEWRYPSRKAGQTEASHVSLNWLLDDNCKIEKI